MDQLIAPRYMFPPIYFYSSNPIIPNSEKINQLKRSLSIILSRFYPLAGRLVDNFYVDCNDAGVPFTEAIANCDLSQVITNPDLNKIKKSLFYKLDESQFFFIAVQATHFRCGGLAVGILQSHKIGDGLSSLMFFNMWSAATKNGGDGSMPFPNFDGAALLPPGNIASPADPITDGLVCKTFTFPASKIALLQDMYSAGRWRPGRVEALSAYIWMRLVSSMGLHGDPTRNYYLYIAADLRSRIKAPMLKYHFGNIGWNAEARPRAGDSGVEVTQKIREAKKAIGEGFVPQLKDLSKLIPPKDDRTLSFVVSSVCGFPLYQVDFGWGEPAWVVVTGFSFKNTALLTDTKAGGGIEAMITLTQQDMDKFELHLDLPTTFKSNL